MSKLKILCAASALALTAGMASAATVEVTGITSQWIDWTGGTNVNTSAAGADPATLRWGTPSGQPSQSGYDFKAAATPFDADADEEFNLGEFTHLNFPISAGGGIKNATLQVTFTFLLDGEEKSLNSAFLFTHDETSNGANPCANGEANNQGVNINGCADHVTVSTILDGTQTITIDDGDGNWREYAFDILGFKVGGKTVSDFWTVEEQTNSANLHARFTYAENINTGPSPVPVPAAGFLLLGGLGALGALSRRRKAA